MRADLRVFVFVPILLCLMLFFAQIPLQGDAGEEPVDGITVCVSRVYAAAGEELTLAVSAEQSSEICGMLLELHYASRFFSFLSADLPAEGNASNGLGLTVVQAADRADSPLRLLWEGTENIGVSGALAFLRFRISEEAPPGCYPFSLSCPDTESVYGVKDFAFYPIRIFCTDGAVTVVPPASDFRYAGCQEITGEMLSVRLCGVSRGQLQKIPSFSVVVASIQDSIRWNGQAQGPYTEVCGYMDGIRLSYTAEQLGGEAIYTVCLDRLPVKGEVRLFLLPCVDERQSGNGWMLVYRDGVYQYARRMDGLEEYKNTKNR